MDASDVTSHAPVLAPSPAERRRDERFDVAIEITMQSDSNFYHGLSANMSEGGVFIATHRDIAVGTVLRLSFRLPSSGRTIYVLGEVRWRRGPSAIAAPGNVFGAEEGEGLMPGVGLKFIDVGDDDLHDIRRFVVIRPPEFFEE